MYVESCKESYAEMMRSLFGKNIGNPWTNTSRWHRKESSNKLLCPLDGRKNGVLSFIGKRRDDTINIWDGCGLRGSSGFQSLLNKNLVELEDIKYHLSDIESEIEVEVRMHYDVRDWEDILPTITFGIWVIQSSSVCFCEQRMKIGLEFRIMSYGFVLASSPTPTCFLGFHWQS